MTSTENPFVSSVMSSNHGMILEPTIASASSSTTAEATIQSLQKELKDKNTQNKNKNSGSKEKESFTSRSNDDTDTQKFVPYEASTMDDYLFQVFLGSISVAGLYILFQFVSRSR